jgi:hypothetical protein
MDLPTSHIKVNLGKFKELQPLIVWHCVCTSYTAAIAFQESILPGENPYESRRQDPYHF